MNSMVVRFWYFHASGAGYAVIRVPDATLVDQAYPVAFGILLESRRSNRWPDITRVSNLEVDQHAR